MRWAGRGAITLAIAANLLIIPATYSPAASADLLAAARQYVGQHERTNRKALKRLIGVDPVLTRWCGAFLGYVARKAGRKPPSGHNLASSWVSYGKPVKLSQAKPGDVLVLHGHVGVFSGFKKGRVCMISGNSKNMVRSSCVSPKRVKVVRR